jgi:hypothetical protein
MRIKYELLLVPLLEAVCGTAQIERDIMVEYWKSFKIFHDNPLDHYRSDWLIMVHHFEHGRCSSHDQIELAFEVRRSILFIT